MSELLPYEQQLQQQWTDIPLPDEDTAWEDMAKRLKDDDDDKGIVFWWRPGCALVGLLLVLLGLGWWIVRPEKSFSNKAGDTGKHTTVTVDQNKSDNNYSGNQPPDTNRSNNNFDHNNNKPVGNAGEQPSVSDPTQRSSISITDHPPTAINVADTANPIDTTDLVDTADLADTAVIKPITKDSVIKPGPASSTDKKATDSAKKNQVFFSAGLTMQQQLPVAGQKSTPYNSQGRKGSLADYIPAVYVRLNKKDKWFLQAEFRYGAPQYSKEFLYQQVSIPDTGTNPRFETTTSARLKKTFYHQLPLTFNYYVLPNWSVGGGVVWNKFYAAVSDRESIKHDNINQIDSVLFKGIVSIKKDTSGTFASSYFQAVLETQYKWKRFSVGARYASGLQPYIRFTLPGAGPKEEKNSSIQIFLRFELWRPKQR